jgi:hypothetical protein
VSSSVIIVTDLVNATEKQILRKICRHQKCRRVQISVFPRYGASGARLILAYFDKKPMPWLIKISSLKKAKEEAGGIRRLQGFVGDCPLDVTVYSAENKGALLYSHVGTDRRLEAEDPVTLRQLLFCTEDECSSAQLVQCLGTVYAKLSEAHKTHSWSEVESGEHYKDYFRDFEAKSALRVVLGKHRNEKVFQFLGATVLNPLKYLQGLPKRVHVPVGLVHGDLHPDNIVVNRHGETHLIDFAWAKANRDILLDYVLLENSIRFWHFPRSVNHEEQLWVDRQFLKERGPEEILSNTFSCSEATHYYGRLATAIGVIRAGARETLGARFSMEGYLRCQFIVLFGVLRFDAYNTPLGVRALGMIARKLKHGR